VVPELVPLAAIAEATGFSPYRARQMIAAAGLLEQHGRALVVRLARLREAYPEIADELERLAALPPGAPRPVSHAELRKALAR
jgi:predicted ATPase